MSLFNLFKKPESKQPPLTLPQQKVLIAEDDEYLLDFYQELMQKEGFETLTATNGQDAVTLTQQNKPDIILLDVMMPVMDGLQVMEKLRSNDLTKHIPIIVLTNVGTIDNMETAKYHNAYQFLIKSNIVPEEIIATVKGALEFSPNR